MTFQPTEPHQPGLTFFIFYKGQKKANLLTHFVTRATIKHTVRESGRVFLKQRKMTALSQSLLKSAVEKDKNIRVV